MMAFKEKIINKFSKFILLSLIFIAILNSCKKEKLKEIAVNETGTVEDIEGNVYNTIKIGNKWWMAENLHVKKYNDNSNIFEVKNSDNDSVWAKQTDGAYCNANQYSAKYGLYYNWFVINNTKKIAPVGWHIPTDDEWKLLEEALGMNQSDLDKTSWRGDKERDKLIEKNSFEWSESQDIPVGTNESGFNALSAGCRLFNGLVGDGKSGYWWSSSEFNNEAWYRNLTANHLNVFRYHTYKTYGFSIRCVKD